MPTNALRHSYGVSTSTPGVTVDIHRPDDETSYPIVVWFHGGGWAAGTSRDVEEIRLWPLAARGFVVVSVEYRLAQAAHHPAQVLDARAALRWLEARPDAHGGRLDAVFLAGASAGGHLAALTALTAHQTIENSSPISLQLRGVLPYYLVLDPLRWDAELADAPAPAPDTFSGRHAAIRGSWPPPPRGRDLLGPAPAHAVPADITQLEAGPGTPPFLSLHGSQDSCVDVQHSVDLHDWLVSHGVCSQLVLLGSADHGDAEFHQGPVFEFVVGFLTAETPTDK